MSGCRNFFQWSCCKIYLSILGRFLKTYFIGRSLFCKVAPIFIDSSAGSRADIQKTNTIRIYFIGDAWSAVLDTGQNKKVVVVEIADHINFLKKV